MNLPLLTSRAWLCPTPIIGCFPSIFHFLRASFIQEYFWRYFLSFSTSFGNLILPFEMYKLQTHFYFTNTRSSQKVKNGSGTPCMAFKKHSQACLHQNDICTTLKVHLPEKSYSLKMGVVKVQILVDQD